MTLVISDETEKRNLPKPLDSDAPSDSSRSPACMPREFGTTEVVRLHHNDDGTVDHGDPIEANPRQFIRSQIERLIRRPDIADDEDIFVAGLDSLLTAELTRCLLAARQLGGMAVDPRDIYEHPTVDALTAFVTRSAPRLIAENSPAGVNGLVHKYTTSLPSPSVRPMSDPRDLRVAIIGSRGSLGSVMTASLVANDAVSQVIYLDRLKEGATPRAADKVVNLEIDLSKHNLGLCEQSMSILSSVSIIIHNAWRVDFNLNLASFEPQFTRSVATLVHLSESLPSRPRIVFISSIAATNKLARRGPGECVPEDVVQDLTISAANGYGYSKLASELVLRVASERNGTPVTILRCGQVGGSVSGRGGEWSRKNTLYAIVHASKIMNIVPNDLPPINWIPSDTLGNIMTELILHDAREPSTLSVYNLVNPNETPWKTFVSALRKRLPHLEPVTANDWVCSLERVAAANNATMEMPAVKVLAYFQGLAVRASLPSAYSTGRGEMHSQAMRQIQAVDEKLIAAWLQQWGF